MQNVHKEVDEWMCVPNADWAGGQANRFHFVILHRTVLYTANRFQVDVIVVAVVVGSSTLLVVSHSSGSTIPPPLFSS